ncbi:MAG TPA: hypothetical protein VKE95_07610 [Burkholderiales bacterium]|nr:hypothetical protein [Burkholderiales bacterium]
MNLWARVTAVAFAIQLAFAGTAQSRDQWVQVRAGTWEPSTELLVELKARLRPYTERQARTQSRSLQRWSKYTFQYYATEERGRRYVWVNALCHVEKDWPLEEELMTVLDGGTCFFNLKYDPSKRQYYDLVFNGEA